MYRLFWLGQSAGRYETGAGQILAGDWRHETGRNLAVALYRWDRMIEGLSEREVAAVDDFYRLRLDAAFVAAGIIVVRSWRPL